MGVTAASLVCMLSLAQAPAGEPPVDPAGLAIIKRDARELQRRGSYDEAALLVEAFASRIEPRSNTLLKDEAERVAARYHAVATSFSRAQADPARCAPLFARVLLAGHRFVPLTAEDAERALALLEGTRPGLYDDVARRLSSRTRNVTAQAHDKEPARARRTLEVALDELERGRL